jgi:hypothetical protein
MGGIFWLDEINVEGNFLLVAADSIFYECIILPIKGPDVFLTIGMGI